MIIRWLLLVEAEDETEMRLLTVVSGQVRSCPPILVEGGGMEQVVRKDTEGMVETAH